MKSSQKIGLFGGTFDPIHDGHIEIASKAREACDLDRVLFIPAYRSPFKVGAETSPAEARVEMCRLATAGLDWAEVSTWEIDQEDTSFSWQTAEHFSSPDSKLHWILGHDQWDQIDRWARSEHLATLVTFIAFARNNEFPTPREGYRLKTVPGVVHPASSTAIREAIANGNEPSHINRSVLDYALEQELY